MIVISHRGNIRGSISDKENRPSYIDCAIGNGYQVEIDVRTIDGELWLGHDEPQYKVDHTWLSVRKNYLWLHCKNLEAAKECWNYNSFCHSNDSFVYTSVGKIWVHDLSMKLDKNVIIPLIDLSDIKENTDSGIFNDVFAICTDYPSYI
jgi:hypothetical protein